MVLNGKCFDPFILKKKRKRLLWLLCEKWIRGGAERTRNDLFEVLITAVLAER